MISIWGHLCVTYRGGLTVLAARKMHEIFKLPVDPLFFPRSLCLSLHLSVSVFIPAWARLQSGTIREGDEEVGIVDRTLKKGKKII